MKNGQRVAEELVPCDRCGMFLHADTSHLVHAADCTFLAGGYCRCAGREVVCAACCPICRKARA